MAARNPALDDVSRRLADILADISTPDDIAAKPSVAMRFPARAPEMDLPPLLQPTESPLVKRLLYTLLGLSVLIPALLLIGYRDEPASIPTIIPTMFPALAAAPFHDQWCEMPPTAPAPKPAPPVSQVPDTALADSFRAAIARFAEAVEPPPVEPERVIPPPRPVHVQTFHRGRDLKDMTDSEARAAPRDICRGKGRYYVNNGKSWRCRR